MTAAATPSAIEAALADLEAARPDDVDYNAADDFAKSILAAYTAVRKRVANGGPPWVPKPPEVPKPQQEAASS